MQEIIRRSLEEYRDRHWEGNYQTLLFSYTPGGAKSQGQIVQDVFRSLEGSYEVYLRDIYARLRAAGIPGKHLKRDASTIAKQLSEQGTRIIQ